MKKGAVLTGILIFLSTLATAGLTVDPGVVEDDAGQKTFNVTVINEGSSSPSDVRLELPVATGTDPYSNFSGSDVTVPSGYDVNVSVRSRDEDTRNDVVEINGTSTNYITFNLSVTPPSVNAPSNQSTHPWNIELSNGEEYSASVVVDGKAPQLSDVSPNETDMTDPAPDISADYTDGTGIGVDTDAVRLLVNGQDVADNATVEQDDIAYANADAGEGQNNVSLYLVDEFGHDTWYNWTFGLAVEPLMTSNGPTGLLDDDSPSITATFADPSGIDESETWIEIEDDGTDRRYDDSDSVWDWSETGTSATATVDLPVNLDDGTHDVTAHTADESDAGNEASFSWEFETDTTPPDVELMGLDEDYYSGDQSFYVEVSDDTTDVEDVTFSLGGEEREAKHYEDEEYVVKFDTTDFSDGDHELKVTSSDEAGNEGEDSATVTIDNEPPEIPHYNLFPELSNVAPQFDMRVEDEASDIVRAEYFFGDDPGEGNGIELEGKGQPGREMAFSSEIDITDLENGEYDFYFRAKDAADHWSAPEHIDFELDRSLRASLEFVSVSDIEVTQGTSTTVDVEVRNAGKVPGNVTLSTNSDLQVSTTGETALLRPGESHTFAVTVSAGADRGLGEYPVTLQAQSYSTLHQQTMTVDVKPDRETQQQISQRVSQLKEKLRELKDQKGKWSDRIDDSLIQNVSKNLSKAENIIRQAETSMENGNYRYADSMTGYLSSSVENTDSTLDKGVEQFKAAKSRRNKVIGLVFMILLLSAGVGAFYQRRIPEEGFDDRGFVKRPEGKHPARLRAETVFNRVQQKIEGLSSDAQRQIEEFTGEDEEEDRGWGGYQPN